MRLCNGQILGLLLISFSTIAAEQTASASDGVLEINQTSALAGSITPGDAAGFPIEIFTRGSFRLTSDLVVPPGAPAGIAVYAGGSRIDLNGFTIASATQCAGAPPSCSPIGSGIGIDASGATDVSIRNGRIAGFGVHGAFLAEESRAENLTVENNGSGGIIADEACVIADNIVRHNGGIGIQAGVGSRIVANAVVANGGQGVSAPVSAVSRGNAVSGNVGSGSAGSR